MTKPILPYLISFLFLLSATLFATDPLYYETGGYGTSTDGGLGGTVYRVTNLKSSGEGSLRYGIEEVEGARIIVFEVGGVIDLEESSIDVKEDDLTIAGQTAPSPGITLIKGGLKVRADDVVVQHIAIRVGDAGYTSSDAGWEPDGFNVSTSNVVFDHCSVSWSIDENMSVSRGGEDVTFYRCLIAEGLSHSIHSKDEHSCGTLVMDGSTDISIIGNMYAHNYRRHPRLKPETSVLFANNVAYNYGIYAAHIGGEQGDGYSDDPGSGSFIGNAFFKGKDGWDDYFIEGHKGDFDKDMDPGNGEAYLEDNIMLNRLTGDTLTSHDEHITILTSPVSVPDGFVAVEARQNLEDVLKYVGSRPGDRSDIDTRIIQSLIDGTGSIINGQDTVGGYPDYDSTYRSLTVPSNANDQRVWLDSISTSLEVDTTLNDTAFLSFVDTYWISDTTDYNGDDDEEEDPDTTVNVTITESAINSLSCYPNPVTENAYVSFTVNKSLNLSVKLYDLLGKEIALLGEGFYTKGSHRIAISKSDYNLSGGIYIIHLTGDKNNIQTLKLSIR